MISSSSGFHPEMGQKNVKYLLFDIKFIYSQLNFLNESLIVTFDQNNQPVSVYLIYFLFFSQRHQLNKLKLISHVWPAGGAVGEFK